MADGSRRWSTGIALLTLVALSCVPRVSGGADVGGAYAFEQKYRGRTESEGLLTLERASDGGWNVYLFHERYGQMEILESDVDPPDVSILAEGPDYAYHIGTQVSGRLMEGHWRYGTRDGTFVGRRR